MKFAVTILGSGSAKPTIERLTSAHVLNVHEHFFLIDCGEGTQVSMMKYNISSGKIHHIFISHLHGDHYFGLIGLINTMHLSGRKRDLHIYCFKELEEIIYLQLKAANTQLTFSLIFHYLHNEGCHKILDNKYVVVHSFPLQHRIPTCGFLFEEKKKVKNIKKDFIAKHAISNDWFPRIYAGEDYIDNAGKVYPNESIVKKSGNQRSYAYCSDTAYDESLVKHIAGVSLLYHEASFADEHEDHALQKFHSTARQAAKIASLAKAEKLIIGHFSSRYKNYDTLLEEASEVFENTLLAEDGLVVDVLY
jgi:ribonuclease Z